MDSLLRGVTNFVNGSMGEVLVKGLPILSMDSLLRAVFNFFNGYMVEALVKGVANHINGLFVARGF